MLYARSTGSRRGRVSALRLTLPAWCCPDALRSDGCSQQKGQVNMVLQASLDCFCACCAICAGMKGARSACLPWSGTLSYP